MRIELDKPELEQFIAEEVQAGRFPSADAAIAAAVQHMMLERKAMTADEETLAAIEEAEAQLDAEEGIPLEEAFTQLRQKYSK
jgi:Arc/MetJ-type ribon-helix-helix transcriptional regulator